ncbi:MAG: 2-oxo acid dehydrogenase subunit E2 [Pseudomonadota bacterium]
MTAMIDVLAPIEQEGTQASVRSWFIAVGDTIEEGEPMVELETDKVAVEVPAPASGTLSEILIDVDGQAEPGACLGRLDTAAGAAQGKSAEPSAATAQRQHQTSQTPVTGPKVWMSPAVKRLVQEHDLDITLIDGTGKDGRVTKADVLSFLDKPAAEPQATPPQLAVPAAKPATPLPSGEAQIIPHDSMRRAIAQHMSHSVTTAPHVTAVFEADFSAIMAHRKAYKEDFAKRGAKLTFTAYILAAAAEAMAAAPTVNSRWHEDHLEVLSDINIGVGTALEDKGLIVPVVRSVQSLNLFGIAQQLTTLTDKARTGALSPSDVRGGTFSLSNHGTSGSLVASPIIINQPQSAILGVGKLEKRVVVKEIDGADTLQIRPLAYVSLTIDHRMLDGHQTNAWLTRFVEVLETWSAS